MQTNNITQRIVNSFTPDNKVNTFRGLLNLYTCSEATLRRRIKQIGLLVSYNFNSKFYTLSSIATFNEYGIWEYEKILFSAYGCLTKTIKVLIYNSPSGYTQNELSLILHVRVNDLLRIQTGKQALKREKTGREYVYYSSDPQVFAAQHKKRQILINLSLQEKDIIDVLPGKDIVISILVEIILSGKLYKDELVQRLVKKTVSVTESEIDSVISYYNLKKTKLK